jgi:hypothetical protein
VTTKKIIGIVIVVLLLACIVLKWNTIRWAYYEIRILRAKRQLFALEKQGKPYRPAHQILYETEWLCDATHDYQHISEHIRVLEDALRDTANAEAIDEQSVIDGSWGKWYTEWFFKLDASYDQITALATQGQVPKYPVHFLDRINSPEKLTGHLNHLLISDLMRESVNHRRELNETISDLMRLILRDQPENYLYDPRLKAALLDWLLNTARNPKTGYWGAWYLEPNEGGIKKTDDLSITFHVVSYLRGNVPDWQKIIATTLAIKDKKYPLGWLERSGYLNHNNMDVVQLFRMGWNQATPDQREAMRIEIRKMLHWCLNESLQPDGSFKLQDNDDSQETCVAFGASFLARLGYFDRSKRFWTDENFPEADKIRMNIIQFIHSHIHSGGEGGFYYHDTLKELGALTDNN